MVQVIDILKHLLYPCRYGPVLESVITITEELAYEQARRADKLLAQGNYLGIHVLFYSFLSNMQTEKKW